MKNVKRIHAELYTLEEVLDYGIIRDAIETHEIAQFGIVSDNIEELVIDIIITLKSKHIDVTTGERLEEGKSNER